MKKITPLQLAFLMVCASSFSMMTYFPYTDDNALVLMIGILISTAIQAVMIIPVLILNKRFAGDNACTLSISVFKPLGFVITGLFLLYFLWSAFMIAGNFTYFMDYYFSNYVARIPVMLTFVATSIYVSRMNISVIGKCAGLVFIGFVLFVIVIIFGSMENFSIVNFQLADSDFPHTLWGSIENEFVKNRSLVIFAFLIPDIKGSAAKCGYTYCAVKVAVLEITLGFITMVLGDYGMVTKLPFFFLAAYSNTEVIERYDAAFMAIWSVMAVIKLGTVYFCSQKSLRLLFPKVSVWLQVALCAAVPAAAATVWLEPHKWEELAFVREPVWFIVVLVFVIPLCLLFTGRGKGFSQSREKA